MIKRAIFTILFVLSASVVASATVATSPALAKSCGPDSGKILQFKPWYYGLVNADCSIKSPTELNTGGQDNGMQRFVTRIVLTIVEDLLQLAVIVTFIFVLMGGFTYLTANGMPDRALKGRLKILHAAVGLVVAMGAIGLVNLLGGYLGI